MSPESKAILDKLGEDEPIFILRGNDMLAPYVVDEWIRMARTNGVNLEKMASAIRHYEAIWDWQRVHMPKLPD